MNDLNQKCSISNQNCVKYIAASYLYYEKNFSVMSDLEFDTLCMDLHGQLDQVTHWAKPLLDKDALLAGTGFNFFGQTPGAIIGIANLWKSEIESGFVQPARYPERKKVN